MHEINLQSNSLNSFSAADDGQVTKVFSSTLTPYEEVEDVRAGVFCLDCFQSGFSLLLNTRWPFISNFLFFAGNGLYVYESVLDLRSLDANSSEDESFYNFLNFTAAILFILNPVSDFLGNWAENEVSEMNDRLHHVEMGSKAQDEHYANSEDARVDWNKWVAIVFLLGSLLYLWQAGLDACDPESSYYVALDITASHVFLFDSILGLIAWRVGRQEDFGTSRQRWVFVWNPWLLDWSG